MKALHLLIAISGILGLSPSDGATLLLDDFSSGSFSLSFGGTTSNSGPFGTPLTDQRTVTGVGFPNWTATLASGDLSYSVDQLDPSPGRNLLRINYFLSSGTFSILGYDAFAVDLSNVIGTGEFEVRVSGNPGGPPDLIVPISGSGTVIYPFSGLETSLPLDQLDSITFRFSAISEDFSATIDNVRIVPEPSTSLLVGFGVASLLFQRRRIK